MKDIKYTGAGIICYIDNTKGTIEDLAEDYLFLILEDKQDRYDFPKGGLDPNEPLIDCAKREAFEEAGYVITDNSIVAGPFRDSYLTIWMAQVYDDPTLSENPHTGILEHEGHAWLPPDKLLGDCYDYLRPTVEWASKYIEDLK